MSGIPLDVRVRILDLSGGAEEGITEEVGPFPDADEATQFARAYVRDSLERCRQPGMDGRAVLAAWLAYGEDAEVIAEPLGTVWTSRPEVQILADHPADEDERDWRALDPRRYASDEAEE
jgi:hypothetical protein